MESKFYWYFGLLTLIWSLNVSAAAPVLILKTPVMVSAQSTEPQLAPNQSCQYVDVTFTIGSGQNQITLTSSPFFCGRDSVAKQLRKQVHWHSPYLAINTSCGGGNAWNCDQQEIYTSKSGSLKYLGSVDDALFLSSKILFIKTFDRFEFNPLVAHMGDHVRVVLRDIDSNLVLDKDLTWLLNLEQYSRYDNNELGCDPNLAKCRQGVKHAAIFNASVAKLAGRSADFSVILRKAKPRMSNDDFEIFCDMFMTLNGQYP